MSSPSPAAASLRKTSAGMWRFLLRRLKANLPLKLISLASALVLYFYVQSERNPTISRPLLASVVKTNAPADVEIETDPQQVLANVSGPKQIVERLKDGDVHAVLDLKGINSTEVKTFSVLLTPDLPSVSSEMKHDLNIDLQTLTAKVTLYPPITRSLPVRATYPKEPPAGFKYGRTEIRPSLVRVSGRADYVNQVDHLVVNAAPSDVGARIEGDFPILARDKNDNPVENIVLLPSRARVYVPLVEDLPSKIVPVSSQIPDQPLPPYSLADIISTPQQVKIVGRPGRLEKISTLETEIVSVRDMTQTQEVTVRLIIPPDIIVRDAVTDKPVESVKLRIEIQKIESDPPPKAAPAVKPPEKTGGN